MLLKLIIQRRQSLKITAMMFMDVKLVIRPARFSLYLCYDCHGNLRQESIRTARVNILLMIARSSVSETMN